MKAESIVNFIQELVRLPSRGGVDSCDAMIAAVSAWLKKKRVPHRVLSDSGRPMAVVVTIKGARPGPTYCLDACLDTADSGDESKWSRPVFGGDIADGWLYGRGSCDSKAAVAIFCHLAAHFHRRRADLAGTLEVLFDADEHTGRFGGVKHYLADCGARGIKPDGVIIGYPGNDYIAAGARGFYRVEITVHGKSAHSGSSSTSGANAVVKAAALAQKLAEVDVAAFGVGPAFPLPGKLTITEIGGGSGFTAVPDSCKLKVDCRLTPTFTAEHARLVIRDAIASVDESFAARKEFAASEATSVVEEESWPQYVLSDDPLVRALGAAATEVYGKVIPPRVVGPSNIGNYLSGKGIAVICGFGVPYKGLHATDECIEVAGIEAVVKTYKKTVERLLGG